MKILKRILHPLSSKDILFTLYVKHQTHWFLGKVLKLIQVGVW